MNRTDKRRAVAVDDKTYEILDALAKGLSKSRRQIVTEAIAGYAVIQELSQTAKPRKETRPCSDTSFLPPPASCSCAQRSSRSSSRKAETATEIGRCVDVRC